MEQREQNHARMNRWSSERNGEGLARRPEGESQSSLSDIAESRQRSSIAQTLEIQTLEKEQRNQILLSLLDLGAGFRQISRITGVPYGVIHRLSSKR